MGEFEEWFLVVIETLDEKMAIHIDVFDSLDWLPSFQCGLTPLDAIKERYGLTI